jgi:hypothetical protein
MYEHKFLNKRLSYKMMLLIVLCFNACEEGNIVSDTLCGVVLCCVVLCGVTIEEVLINISNKYRFIIQMLNK